MNCAELNRRFESAYHANPVAVTAFMTETAELVNDAIDRTTGIFSYEEIFNQVRSAMPNAGDLGITPALADSTLQLVIQQTVDLKSQLPVTEAESEKELAMIDRVIETMKRHGFKTAGEALAFLKKQQLN